VIIGKILIQSEVPIDAETVGVHKGSADLVPRKCNAQPSRSTSRGFAGLPEATQFAGISCIQSVRSCCPVGLHND
jgi:hypothetical protein